MRSARAKTNDPVPGATLCYVWDNSLPAGKVLDSPFTHQLRYVVVRSGPAGLGEWHTRSATCTADFKRVFGDESPDTVPPLIGIAIGADSDNTKSTPSRTPPTWRSCPDEAMRPRRRIEAPGSARRRPRAPARAARFARDPPPDARVTLVTPLSADDLLGHGAGLSSPGTTPARAVRDPDRAAARGLRGAGRRRCEVGIDAARAPRAAGRRPRRRLRRAQRRHGARDVARGDRRQPPRTACSCGRSSASPRCGTRCASAPRSASSASW